MANPFSKGWKYLMQSLDTKIEENADPKVQIDQATEAAKKQHREVTESASRIIGNRNQLEMKLNRLVKDQEKLQQNARTALQQADAATAAGDQAKATELTNTAEVFATQLVTVEQELETGEGARGVLAGWSRGGEEEQSISARAQRRGGDFTA